VLNLIDTPGHVDFGYEVSRSLAACEGVVLVVDASQGIEAQTLANCYLALENDLEIVAVPQQDRPAGRRAGDGYAEIEKVLGIPAEEVLHISAKTGEGVGALLDAVSSASPPPVGDADAPLQALIFDSHFDQYRGVVSSVRVMNGRMRTGAEAVVHVRREAPTRPIEIGVRRPTTRRCRAGSGRGRLPHRRHQGRGRGAVGETVTDNSAQAGTEPLEGYRDPKPMVFCGLYPVDGDAFDDLRESLEKLRLNDSSFTYEPETSARSASGSAAASWGLLHMEIVRERLEREFDLSLIATAPSVEYRIVTNRRRGGGGRQPGRACRRPPRSRRSSSRSSPVRSSRRRTTSARSWSCARRGVARWRRWSTCRPNASS
jgi:GTP-binding protein LepA